eukprot:1136993-Pelagomonas_calceolata.AAC.3
MDGSGSSAGGGSPACRGSSNACEVACCTLLLFCPPPSISVPFLFAALASTGFSCSTALLLPPPTNPSPTKLPPSAQVTPATPACCSKDTLFACLLVAACLCWALGADPPPPLPFHCSMLQGGCSPNRLGGPKREGESGGTAACVCARICVCEQTRTGRLSRPCRVNRSTWGFLNNSHLHAP